MQAYIANLNPDLELNKIVDKSYIVYFSGNDFQSNEFKDFKSENLILIKDLKKEIEKSSDFLDTIIFSGGEPCLQRLSLVEIARFAKLKKLKTILYTNGSKPESINSLIKEDLIDIVYLKIDSPFNYYFEKITKSKTFFKSSEEIIVDIKRSIKLLNNSNVKFYIKTKLSKILLEEKNNIIEIAKIINETNSEWIIDKESYSDKFLETIKEMCKNYNINFANEF
jgi:pyruvate-formate lyase-activating enzyme